MYLDYAVSAKARLALVLLTSFLAAAVPSFALAATYPDGDGDLMPDDWESAYGFNPYDPADAVLDTDIDGFINVDEYRMGTDPLDVTAYPAVTLSWFESFEAGFPADWDASGG